MTLFEVLENSKGDDMLAAILKGFPKPWGVSKGDQVALTPNGREALLGIVIAHADEAALERAKTFVGNRRAFLLALHELAEVCCKEHRDMKDDAPSCVPELTNMHLALLMSVLSIQLAGEAAHA